MPMLGQSNFRLMVLLGGLMLPLAFIPAGKESGQPNPPPQAGANVQPRQRQGTDKPKPELEFVETSQLSLEVSYDEKVGAAKTTVFLSNEGGQPVKISNFSAVAQDASGASVGDFIKLLPTGVEGHSVEAFELNITVLISYLLPEAKKKGLGERLGLPEWDSDGSWATNLTVFGGLLGTIISSEVLPAKTHHLQKAEYMSLHLLFGALVVIAPLVYRAILTPITGAADGDDPQHEGYVWLFLLSSVATLWGVFGQLGTIGLLLDELHKAKLMSEYAIWLFEGFLIIVGILLIAHAGRMIRSTVKEPVAKQPVPRPAVTAPRRWALL